MKRFVPMLAWLLTCAISISAAEDCTPTSTTGTEQTTNCSVFSNSLAKSVSYIVKYPNDAAGTMVVTRGAGTCGGGLECWPEFHPEEYGDGFWRKRIVDKQAAYLTGSQVWACSYWRETTFEKAPGQTSCPQSCEAGGGYDMQNGCTPVIVDILGNGFQLTNAYGGVDFDFDGDGQPVRTAWTAASSDDAWLVLDRNGNGLVDNGSELFGNFTPQPPASEPNGYIALAEHDKITNGGNGNGKIDDQDAIYDDLRLWRDGNHNGVSESTEMDTLRVLGLASIDLDYRQSRRRDRYGNLFLYRAKVDASPAFDFGRWSYDVILVNRR